MGTDGFMLFPKIFERSKTQDSQEYPQIISKLDFRLEITLFSQLIRLKGIGLIKPRLCICRFCKVIYIYIYIYMYVCVCVWLGSSLSFKHVWLNDKDTFCLYNFIKILISKLERNYINHVDKMCLYYLIKTCLYIYIYIYKWRVI